MRLRPLLPKLSVSSGQHLSWWVECSPPPPHPPPPMPAKEQVRTRSAFSKVTYLLVLGNARTKYQIPKDKWVRRGSKSPLHLTPRAPCLEATIIACFITEPSRESLSVLIRHIYTHTYVRIFIYVDR